MVYVLDIDGQPLMPTSRHRKVRKLLNSHLAKVVKRCPFTIQLLYQSTKETQPVSLGVDAGSRHIGLAATTEQKVVYQQSGDFRYDAHVVLHYYHAYHNTDKYIHLDEAHTVLCYRNRTVLQADSLCQQGAAFLLPSLLDAEGRILLFLHESQILAEFGIFS